MFNLSKMSVWWLRLGIAIERIKPGHPQQNGCHERMHLTLKKEATRPPGMNCLQQQARFDEFMREFNRERPHEALAMKTPGELYAPSARPYQGLPDVSYPLHDREVVVTSCGRICMHRKRINLSGVLAGQRVGIKAMVQHRSREKSRKSRAARFASRAARPDVNRSCPAMVLSRDAATLPYAKAQMRLLRQ